jgi:hypothetical protein
MKLRKFASYGATVSCALLFGLSAVAEDRIEQVWSCTLNEGKTLEDLNAAQTAWVQWANKQSYGGGIRGYVSQTIVGSDVSAVYLIDSYPDMATFAADTVEYAGEEGQELEKGYNVASNCTSNALFFVMVSG